MSRYARMLWNCPLSEAHATTLLAVLDVSGGRSIVDLGCGWAELLLRALAAAPAGVRGIGVDTDQAALARARALATDQGLVDRVTFDAMPAADWSGSADRVICIGAAHAFGGTDQALQSLRRVVAPGGRALFGDGIWQVPPGEEALAMFGQDVRPLTDLAEAATNAGWRVLHLSTADQREWDVFESSWRQGRQEWLLGHAGDHHAAEVRADLDQQQRDYLHVYRGVLGFAYLVLGH